MMEQLTCVYQVFERAALKYKDHVAMCDGDVVLTYAELLAAVDELSAKIYHLLISDGSFDMIAAVPILLPRSYHAVITVLAVLKIQKPFFALSEMLPSSSINTILAQNNASLIISNAAMKDKYIFEDHMVVIDIDNLLANDIGQGALPELNNSNKLAYFIYTSGTTGAPKCVQQTHKTLLNLIQWQDYCAHVDTVLNRASLFFDVAVQEIFFAFLNGARLIIMPDEIKYDGLGFAQFIQQQKINYLQVTPSFLKTVAQAANSQQISFPDIEYILASGEALIINDDIQKMLTNNIHIKLVNQYGPSETHVVTEFHLQGDEYGNISIGKPIVNTDIYLLDQQNNPVVQGEVGELCISGAGLCEGYAGVDPFPKHKFLANTFDALSTKLYKTGDLAALDASGNLTFHGRSDRQIQLEGYRIELDALESCVRKSALIEDCVAIHDAGRNPQKLYLFVVPSGDVAEYVDADCPNEVRRCLKLNAPSYAKFDKIIVLDALPLNINGKIDYAKLKTDYISMA